MVLYSRPNPLTHPHFYHSSTIVTRAQGFENCHGQELKGAYEAGRPLWTLAMQIAFTLLFKPSAASMGLPWAGNAAILERAQLHTVYAETRLAAPVMLECCRTQGAGTVDNYEEDTPGAFPVIWRLPGSAGNCVFPQFSKSG
jgi:hypothetical protein